VDSCAEPGFFISEQFMVTTSFHDSDRVGYPIWDDRNHNNPCSLAVRQ
jgi:hypothetical protein